MSLKWTRIDLVSGCICTMANPGLILSGKTGCLVDRSVAELKIAAKASIASSRAAVPACSEQLAMESVLPLASCTRMQRSSASGDTFAQRNRLVSSRSMTSQKIGAETLIRVLASDPVHVRLLGPCASGLSNDTTSWVFTSSHLHTQPTHHQTSLTTTCYDRCWLN